MSEKCDRIHHVAIPVSDLNRAANWYETSFSCTEVYRDRSQVILQFENIRLALVLPSHQQPHLAFERSDAGSLGELKEQPDGCRSTYLSDSSGNIVEIVAKGN